MSERYVDLSPNVVVAVLALGIVGPVAVGALAPQAPHAPAPAASQAAPPPSAKPTASAAGSAAKPAGPSADIPAERLEAFKALPVVMESKDNPVTDEKVALGRTLYFETRLSKNHDLSCASCHDLQKFGVDGKDFSDGHKGQKGGRNAPSVYNAALHVAQFWDGRAKDVEEQAGGPILNPLEMAMKDEAAVLDTLKSIPDYKGLFTKAFPDDKEPISYGNLKKAIGAFERKLVTPSKWDKFLGGDKAALSDDEKKGFNVFFETGCVTCHSGPGVGGGSFQKLGAVKPWPNQKDTGKAEVSKADADKMMFKVASLRNVEHTGPYFHDASAKTLDDAVKLMATHQLGKDLAEPELKLLVGWLKTLSGEIPADYVKAPELPKSGDKTPKADPG